MNIHHPTAAEQMKSARDLKNKFYGKPSVVNRAVITTPVHAAPDYAEQIARLETLLQQAERVSEELHERLQESYRSQPVGTLEEKVMEIIRPILDRNGLTFQHIIAQNRTRSRIAVREECWRAAYEGLWMHSVLEIATVFKRRQRALFEAAWRGKWDDGLRMKTRPRQAAQNDKGPL